MQRRGLGLQMFYRQARNAADLVVDRIETVAGRNNGENGYYAWPRYGFQGPLPASVRHLLPVGLECSHTILDLMLCEKGRDWWREHGVTTAVRFDLVPGSRSRRTLARYVRERIRAGGGWRLIWGPLADSKTCSAGRVYRIPPDPRCRLTGVRRGALKKPPRAMR